MDSKFKLGAKVRVRPRVVALMAAMGAVVGRGVACV